MISVCSKLIINSSDVMFLHFKCLFKILLAIEDFSCSKISQATTIIFNVLDLRINEHFVITRLYFRVLPIYLDCHKKYRHANFLLN